MLSIQDYFGSDDTELPSARLISRDDFSGESFDVDEFLTKSHKYQTLDDLHRQLKKWDEELSKELIDIINAEYDDFVGQDKALEGGNALTQDVKLEVLRFQSEIKRVRDVFEDNGNNVQKLYKERKALKELERMALLLLEYSTRISDIDAQLSVLEAEETKEEDVNEQEQLDQLEILTKSCVVLYALRQKCIDLSQWVGDISADSAPRFIQQNKQELHDIKARVQRVLREELRKRQETVRDENESHKQLLSNSLLKIVGWYHKIGQIAIS